MPDRAASNLACDAPPAAACLDSEHLRTYEPVGSCQNGSCAYTSMDTPCPKGCSNATCVDCIAFCSVRECGNDGCGGACGTCNAPPAPTCVDGQTLRTFNAAGRCESGDCVYDQLDTPCATGCAGEACNG